jgi:hypothetical protein
MDKQGRTLLRTAYLKEELRSSAFRRICREALLLLDQHGLAPLALKGVALAETVYPNPVLRHCHDIDILLLEPDIGRAAGLLEALGFNACSERNPPVHNVRMVHETELPLELHSRLFDVPYYHLPVSEIRERTRRETIVGISARILAMSDNLLHVCGHASYSPSRGSFRWVTDAWFLIERSPGLDWDLVVYSTRRSHLALPLAVMLRYLAEHLHAPVPPTVLKRLSAATFSSTAMERQLALRGVRSSHASLKNLLQRTTNWRERLFVIQWLLFPTPGYLSWVDQIRCRWVLPFHYVYRPLRYAACRLRSILTASVRWSRPRLERWILNTSFRSPGRSR